MTTHRRGCSAGIDREATCNCGAYRVIGAGSWPFVSTFIARELFGDQRLDVLVRTGILVRDSSGESGYWLAEGACLK